ncbi:hypothetical protein I6F15_28930 [Bradyrhizobium sp. BRP14]|nr:hypothetical protein [Bradyrhizobium sp. BRP14]
MTLLTLAVSASTRYGLIPSSIYRFLAWFYLLTAFGAALTGSHFVDATTAHIRHASRLMRPAEPDLAARILLTQLWLTTAGLIVLSLRPPPEALRQAGLCLGNVDTASIAWPALMTGGVACFGAMTYATIKAL